MGGGLEGGSALHIAVAAALALLLALPLLPSPGDPVAAGTPPPLSSGSGSLTLAGQLPISVEGKSGFNGDVWVHTSRAGKRFAYVGSWGVYNLSRPELCRGVGVKIIDLTDPYKPTLVTRAAAMPGTTAEDMVVLSVHTPSFDGDLLATGIQRCHVGANRGVDLWDVTDPAQPRHLALWTLDTAFQLPRPTPDRPGPRGVHELYGFTRGRDAYLLLAIPFLESWTAIPLPSGGWEPGVGDFVILNVTDPRNPAVASSWGAWRKLGLPPWQGRGNFSANYAHSAWADEAGRTAYVAYWDAGAIILDISDVRNPRLMGRTFYGPREEGNAHSVMPAGGGRLLIVTDENFHPEPTRGNPSKWTTDTDGGWGYARIFDISDPSVPRQVGIFATPHSREVKRSAPGDFTVHNPWVMGNTLYLSWYSDGIRVVDLSDPSAPREVGALVPPGASDPNGVITPPGVVAPEVWGLYVTEGMVVASDMNFGLYVMTAPELRTAAGAAPSQGSAPLAVRFEANASGGIGAYTFQWDLGDGSSSHDASPVHNYTKGGSYDVTLTVGDESGQTVKRTLAIMVAGGLPAPLQLPVPLPIFVGAGGAAVGATGTALYLRWRRRVRPPAPPPPPPE